MTVREPAPDTAPRGFRPLTLAVRAEGAMIHRGHCGADHPVNRLADGRAEIIGRPEMGVQYHSEVIPGPQDSAYLSGKFVDHLDTVDD